jgi:predicted DNA-binding WGR domain protein
VLRRFDPDHGIARFYAFMVERDLFGTIRLVCNWGRIGTASQEPVQAFVNEIEAGQALDAVTQVKPRRAAAG